MNVMGEAKRKHVAAGDTLDGGAPSDDRIILTVDVFDPLGEVDPLRVVAMAKARQQAFQCPTPICGACEYEFDYGEPPAAVQQLLEYAQLRLLCRQVGVTGIERKRDTVSVRFAQNAKIDPEKLLQFVAKERGAQFTPDGMLKFALKVAQPEEVLGRLEAWLKGLAG